MPTPHHLLALGVITMVVLAGCRQRATVVHEEPTPSASSVTSSAVGASRASDAAVAALEAFFADPKAPLVPSIEDALYLDLETCAMKGEEVDPDCAGYKAWRSAEGRHSRTDNVGSKRVAQGQIMSPGAATRCVAASVIAQVWGPDTTSVLLDAANKEQVPDVLACMVRRGHVTWTTYPTPAVTSFLSRMTENESEVVRRAAVGRLLFPRGITTDYPDGFLKAADRIERDPSIALRAFVCENLYETEDERALPLFAKHLEAKDTPNELYAACFSGVVSAWARNPRHEKPSRAAYELTMKLLEAKPRTQTRPPSDGLGMVGLASATAKSDDREDQGWSKKVAPWYRPDRLRTVLEDLALDADAHVETRSSAVFVLKQLGAPKATFTRMAKACEKQGERCTQTSAYSSLMASGGP